jgi:hypothetical protein
MNDLLTNMRRELAQLEAEVKNDPRIIKINGLKDLISVYEAKPAVVKPLQTVKRSPPKSAKRPAKGSKEKEVKAEIQAFLTRQGSTHRKVLLDHLIELKLMGWEKNPLKSLAIYLAKWRDEFASDGEGNYSIRD